MSLTVQAALPRAHRSQKPAARKNGGVSPPNRSEAGPIGRAARQPEYGAVTLTEKGRQTATDVTQRNNLLYSFFPPPSRRHGGRRQKLEDHLYSAPLRTQGIGKEIS